VKAIIVEAPELLDRDLEFRPLRGEEDLPGVCAAIGLSLAHDGIDDCISVDEARDDFATPTERRDPSRDSLLALAEGRIIGYAQVGWYEELADKRLYSTISYLEPAFRGRGIRREMLRRCEARAREMAAGHPGGIRKIHQAWSADPERDWPLLLASEGYREVRHFWDMVRPIEGPLGLPALPDGLVTRSVGQAELRAVWEAQRSVAPDHWQYRVDEWTESGWESWRRANAEGRELWQVAWEGDRVAGMVLASIDAADNARRGARRGLTEHIFVRSEWRGRGLASALIARALEALRAAGMEEAFLGVDEENPSGAFRLYEKLGYRPVRKDTWHRKWLERPAGWGDEGLD
jgi:GNAT superfamily N-acetyltransferase